MLINNQHFHDTQKDCNIIKTRRTTGNPFKYKTITGKTNILEHYFQYNRCKTHRKDVCHCGWEIGWHNGENNRLTNS